MRARVQNKQDQRLGNFLKNNGVTKVSSHYYEKAYYVIPIEGVAILENETDNIKREYRFINKEKR